MPLIMITGYPSSGKTTTALKLKDALEKRIKDNGEKYTVELINDEALSIPKEDYRNAQSEKMLRGTQISAVKRALSKTNIVILDNLTYIKGLRYQLYCDAKTCMTTSCVMQVGAPSEMCKQWNSNRPDKWADDLFDALVFRYEEPNGMSRWDSPLFTIPYTLEELPMDELWDVLVLKKPQPPNKATVLSSAKPSNYMTELDKVTTDTLNKVMELHKEHPGAQVQISESYPHRVQLPMRLSLPQMNRYRRNFVSLNKMHPTDISRIEPLFIEFLVKNWDTE